MKNIWSIINGIAWQHGISNPGILEAGAYPLEQARVLLKMGKKCLKSKSAHSFYLYVRQKAKFISKRLNVVGSNTNR